MSVQPNHQQAFLLLLAKTHHSKIKLVNSIDTLFVTIRSGWTTDAEPTTRKLSPSRLPSATDHTQNSVEGSSIGPFSDSGYASMGRKPTESLIQIPQTLIESDMDIMPIGVETDLGTSDAATLYSTASTVTKSAKDRYISYLVYDLLDKIQIPVFATLATVTKMSEILPEALKAFAKKLNSTSQTQESRDLMVFIHRYRL